MRWLDQLKRKRDGWVERKRGIQKMFAEKTRDAPKENVPEPAGERVPAAEVQSVKKE